MGKAKSSSKDSHDKDKKAKKNTEKVLKNAGQEGVTNDDKGWKGV
ncbi:MAG: hypothetical protein PHX14_00120 [Syntrophomonadaceae bacterium]|nr:hypothetical protein [Syntrophomonadaceae bacterium]